MIFSFRTLLTVPLTLIAFLCPAKSDEVPDKILGMWNQGGSYLCLMKQQDRLIAYDAAIIDNPTCPVKEKDEKQWVQKMEFLSFYAHGNVFEVRVKTTPNKEFLKDECKTMDCSITEKNQKLIFSRHGKYDNLSIQSVPYRHDSEDLYERPAR